MGEVTKIAVNPPIQVGGSIFTPEQLAMIGTLAGSGARIEMTPFKQLYVEVPLEQRDRIKEELERSGLEVYPTGFVTKSLIACNFCKGADAAGLETARSLNQAIVGIETPAPLKIGYAGCALGTSEPLLKDIGVVKMRDTFDIYVGGEPKGLKASTGRLLASGVTEEQLIPVIVKIVDYYKAHAKGKEKFSKFVNRLSIEQIHQNVK
ncbi:nitrite reductase [Brevibacillus agri]|jgi:NAD(P)H-nitrite reductase large subunit|uniref:nitrite reductase n=1 Tax=Brevibacillus TaxID=55080 RepID=UPI002E1BE92B|nr:nitrite reductase [Brevibacillus agri]MED1657487.1 nitrite reductase [Brevibacillus agri]MED1690125.1 nitrite reductase [Brevibacillus agri]MED1694441.1 nitrite reductase [Brevibacillus agri]MED1700303.1 nitrite reductase [Brevibacillus agri]